MSFLPQVIKMCMTPAKRFLREADGQDLVEYALLAATIALAVIGAMRLVANALNSEFSTMATVVTGS
jgi:pilus assembly protein Flp/PilA